MIPRVLEQREALRGFVAGDDEGLLDQSEIEALFSALGESTPASKPGSSGSPSQPTPAKQAPPPPPTPEFKVQPYALPELGAGQPVPSANDLSLILDVDLNVRVELGRTKMYVEEVLKLREGSIVPLEKLAGDPVDIFVNGQLLARGEVLVLNDNFCVRVSEIVGENVKGRAEAS
ncbi:MAG: flagellar motor switch protein FliN [Planctomycetota bacterium]